MYCKKCGAYNADWSPCPGTGALRFCVQCGTQLDAVPEGGAAPPAPVPRPAPTPLDPPGPLTPNPDPARPLTPTPEPPRPLTPTPEPARPLTPPRPVVPPEDDWDFIEREPERMHAARKRSRIPLLIGGFAAFLVLLVVGYFTIHIWKDADCENPKTCVICGVTRGKPSAHTWQAATCTEPKTCSVCGKTEGAALAHIWSDATCTEPKTCSLCGATEGAALGHDWQAATYTAPQTCARCGMTQGNVRGWVGDVNGSFAQDFTSIDSAQGHAYVFERPLAGCRRMMVHFKITEYKGSPFGTYAIFAHSTTTGWYRAATFEISPSDFNRDLVIPVTFSDTPTIDAIMPACLENVDYNFSYSLSVDAVPIS